MCSIFHKNSRCRKMTNAEFLRALAAVCGGTNIVPGDCADGEKYLRDFLQTRRGRAIAIVKPQTTAQVSKIVKLCAKTKTPIVPQGGNTGYRAGCVPREDGRAIILATEKMCAPPDIDVAGSFMTVRAGCTLENAQNAAAEKGMFFPLDIGAKGSCQIGGNLATNAGGVNFLRYGGARELCLGVEAVLPSGEIVNLLRGARKNNAGYDLKNLLIGAEGTLGIITAATFKLFPQPAHRATAFVAVRDVGAAVALAALCRERIGETMESLEMMPRALFALLQKHLPQIAQPFAEPPPMAVLIEVAGNDNVAAQLQDALAVLLQNGIAEDAVFAISESQRRAFWAVREFSPEVTRREGKWLKLDVCLPPNRIAAFVAEVERIVGGETPAIVFGHLGDGNLHLSFRPHGASPEESPALSAQISARILALAESEGGSFSAEHGIGRTHAALLPVYRDAAAMATMRAIKNALDPDGIMNPGVLLSD